VAARFSRVADVQKNEFFSICEDANVPGGVVPWHLPCKVGGIPCELGAECLQGRFGTFCNPVDDVIAQSPGSSRRSASAGATAGAVLGVLALLILAAGVGFGASEAPCSHLTLDWSGHVASVDAVHVRCSCDDSYLHIDMHA